MVLSAPLKSKHLKWPSTLNKGRLGKHCICKLTLSILGKHKLLCEEEQTRARLCLLLLLLSECVRGLPLPHLP